MSTMTHDFILGHPEFEQRALGVALRDRTSAMTIINTLKESDFIEGAHRALYRVISDRLADGLPLDPPLLGDALDRFVRSAPEYGVEDGRLVVIQTLSGAGGRVALQEYLAPICAYAKARDLLSISKMLSTYAMTSEGDVAAVDAGVAAASSALLDLGSGTEQAAWQDLGDLMTEVASEEGAPVPVMSSGFPDLDRILNGGFYATQVTVIAARPGKGKSTLAMDLARNASLRQGVPGIVVALEMTGQELAQRAIAAEAGVNLEAVQRPEERTDDDRDLIDSATERLRSTGLMISSTGETTLPGIKRIITNAVQQHGAQYAIVDYLQLMTSHGGTSRNVTREQIVGAISREMKALAMRLGIPVILVAQLNRGPEQRADKLPQLSDLRESGQLEQDASVVLLLHSAETPERKGEVDVLVAKNRNGRTGPVTLLFQGHLSRFVSRARETTWHAA